MGRSYLELRKDTVDPYQARVETVYAESAEMWEKVLGPGLWFQYGVFVGETDDFHAIRKSGQRYLEQQISRAEELGYRVANTRRVLDIGCGWGGAINYLAQRLPECPLLDGINISHQQLDHCEKMIDEAGLRDRVKLYHCNARDIDLLPSNHIGIDLALFRGSIAHFPYKLLEETIEELRPLMAAEGRVIISETLYNIALENYQSPIRDERDRLACGYRKTRDYVLEVLTSRGFKVELAEVLPSQEDAIRWFRCLQKNIEAELPGPRPSIMAELYECAENLICGFQKGTISVYSIIAVPV